MELSGLLNVNKPRGISSFKAVSIVKRALKAKKAGHCGTLDPEADGVLLVLLGKATKLQERMMSLAKTYRAGILFGVETDTGDMAGKIISKRPVPGGIEQKLPGILSGFTGEIEQVPPMFSALKYGGKKLYELARKGLEVPRSPRKIRIYGIEILKSGGDRAEILVECSRGTYIRTLVQDIGSRIGCGATLERLTRTKIGPFDLKDSIDIHGSMNEEEIASRILTEERLLQIADFKFQINDKKRF